MASVWRPRWSRGCFSVFLSSSFVDRLQANNYAIMWSELTKDKVKSPFVALFDCKRISLSKFALVKVNGAPKAFSLLLTVNGFEWKWRTQRGIVKLHLKRIGLFIIVSRHDCFGRRSIDGQDKTVNAPKQCGGCLSENMIWNSGVIGIRKSNIYLLLKF